MNNLVFITNVFSSGTMDENRKLYKGPLSGAPECGENKKVPSPSILPQTTDEESIFMA